MILDREDLLVVAASEPMKPLTEHTVLGLMCCEVEILPNENSFWISSMLHKTITDELILFLIRIQDKMIIPMPRDKRVHQLFMRSL